VNSLYAPPFLSATMSAPRVAILSLSPRVGRSFLACRQAVRILEDAAVSATFASTVDVPLVAAGLDDVPGHTLPAEVTALADLLGDANAVVVGAPVHRSAVAGISRNWIELLRAGLVTKPVLPLVAAGSVRAHLAATAFQSDLLLNFETRAMAPVVLTPELSDDEVEQRLVAALGDLVSTATAALPVGARA
jgi:NAD(P)H-dependent FMN reductase